MRAVINVPVCPLFSAPDPLAERSDEALLGMEAELLSSAGPGWAEIRTFYGYTGFVPLDALAVGPEAGAWPESPKRTVLRGVCDVQAAPSLQSPLLSPLVRGCVVTPLDRPRDGWQRAALPDGRAGFVRAGFLGPRPAGPDPAEENALRAAVVRSALSYLGAAYRWGGKTPMGIDCSGLCFMAYLLHGVVIWRDAKIRDGYPVRPIDPARLAPADLIFFPGHVAMYLGGGRYVHATARAGSDGVVINSLDPRDPAYRPDLPGMITAYGSVFS